MNRSSAALRIALFLALVILASDARAVVLDLQNGWIEAPYGNGRPEVFQTDGVVHFKGAIAFGASTQAFTLPPGYRPSTRVYTHVDLCGANPGRMQIETTGEVNVVDADGGIVNASCFVSLDGAKFLASSTASTPMVLLSGWSGAPFGTAAPSAQLIDGIVHLKGAVSGGLAPNLFFLPPGMRPATAVYVRVDLCQGRKGRLVISPSGDVSVNAVGPLSDAQCFTSLEGASFAVATTGFTELTLQNGWTNAPFSTSNAAASMADDGIVRFKGAVSGGSSALLFTLPDSMRPTTTAWIPIDLCVTQPGRLRVQSSGEVFVEFVGSTTFELSAQCFTSLDGASFIPSKSGFQPIDPLNGWINGQYGTQTTAVASYDGVVHFKGALTNGSSPTMFTLPVTARPDTDIYVSADLCNAAVGRVRISPNGSVSVESPTNFGDAQCFTSLESVSYLLDSTNLTPLSLLGTWQPAPLSNAPAAKSVDGMVRLRGAIRSGGSGGGAFVMPPSLAPLERTELVVPVPVQFAELAGLVIGSNGAFVEGAVLTRPETYGPSRSFTSLEGVNFPTPSNPAFKPLTLLGLWIPYPYLFAPESPAATIVRDIVYLKGSISTPTPVGVGSQIFNLPPILRPEGEVYVPIVLCDGATKGRLHISPSGIVSVAQVGGGLDLAGCRTFLDGVSYAVPEPSGLPALMAGLVLLTGIGTRRAARLRSRASSASQ